MMAARSSYCCNCFLFPSEKNRSVGPENPARLAQPVGSLHYGSLASYTVLLLMSAWPLLSWFDLVEQQRPQSPAGLFRQGEQSTEMPVLTLLTCTGEKQRLQLQGSTPALPLVQQTEPLGSSLGFAGPTIPSFSTSPVG